MNDVADQVWSYQPSVVLGSFARTSWGHRGYDEASVDAYRQHVTQQLAAAAEQVSDLRAEIDRLHRYIRRQWAAVAAAEAARDRSAGRPTAGDQTSPAAQARAVLSQAQEIAERRLAEADDRLAEAERLGRQRLFAADEEAKTRLNQADDAVTRQMADGDRISAQRLARVDAIVEQVLSDARKDAAGRRARALDDSHRLLVQARTRYEDIVVRAHQRADRAAELALEEFHTEPAGASPEDVSRARVELEVKAAYLRTFAKVSRVALHAALDLTAREFDRLLGVSASHELQAEAAFTEPAKAG